MDTCHTFRDLLLLVLLQQQLPETEAVCMGAKAGSMLAPIAAEPICRPAEHVFYFQLFKLTSDNEARTTSHLPVTFDLLAMPIARHLGSVSASCWREGYLLRCTRLLYTSLSVAPWCK
jgi:hypothetical protein